MNMFNISFLRIEISTVGFFPLFLLLLLLSGSSLGGIRLLPWPQEPSKVFFYKLLMSDGVVEYDECDVCW